MHNGWDDSASAWIEEVADNGDYGREFVLDAPMMERVRAHDIRTALDVGCGEGRFCRMLQTLGISTVGVDPTDSLLRQAKQRDPNGDYRIGRAERLEFLDASFDLVVSYLTLIDITDMRAAIAEMARVLRPGGTLLIANLTSFSTAAVNGGWTTDASGEPRYCIDQYLTERAQWEQWRGMRVLNWHRPLSVYLSALLAEGLILRYFDEPAPAGGDPAISVAAQHAAR